MAVWSKLLASEKALSAATISWSARLQASRAAVTASAAALAVVFARAQASGAAPLAAAACARAWAAAD